MPRLVNRIPRLCRNSRGQAVVKIDGRQHYLGKFGTNASKRRYAALIFELQSSGQVATPKPELTVVELVAKYWMAEAPQKPKARNKTKIALRCLKDLYADLAVEDFGPKRLKAVRETMIAKQWGRNYINDQVGSIKRMFKWGVSEELVDESIWRSLTSVENLQKGKSKAKEGKKVRPVADDIVEKTLQHLGPTVADMVRVQRLIGGRPQDVYNLRPCDLDRSGDVWIYQPPDHKREWRDEVRTLYIGPQAQAILAKYLFREPEAYCFSPREAEEQRRATLTAQRKTPLSCGNRPGTNKKRKPAQEPGQRYSAGSYCRAIQRAAKRAGVPKWAPNQLRHSSGTEVRRDYGIEAAQVFLGHKRADVTQIYAERNNELGIKVAKEIG